MIIINNNHTRPADSAQPPLSFFGYKITRYRISI